MKIFICIVLVLAACLNTKIESKEALLQAQIQQYIARPNATWFNEISRDFPRGADARVVDINTGLEFNIRRTFGTNHADIEPLTKEDTAIMYYIWGGFSWERRAVLVYTGGYVFAGSLTNFPHAGVDGYPPLATVNNRSGGYGRGLNFDAIAGNGVSGHMCLHFYGSLTHVTNRTNAQHSARIAQAREHLLSTSYELRID